MRRKVFFAALAAAATVLTGMTAWGEWTEPAQIRRSFLGEYDPEDYFSYGYGSIDTIGLGTEDAQAHPALAAGLEAFSDELAGRMRARFDEGVQDAKQARQDGYEYETFLEEALLVRRADERVFSFLEYASSYQGGAHGYYSLTGRNYDTATGEALSLDQVVIDENLLRVIVEKKLEEKYPDGSWGTLGTTLDDYGSGEGRTPFNWVLSPGSLTVLFNPYELASYAEGILAVNIGFDEYPALFTPGLDGSDGAWVYELIDWIDEEVDLDEDGNSESIVISGEYQDGSYGSLDVSVGQRAASVSDLYYYQTKPFLFRTQDGRYYLYVMTTMDNDYRQLQIFGFAGTSPYWVGSFDGGVGYDWDVETDEGIWQIPLSPDSFRLERRSDVLSTYTVYQNFHIGDDGMPVPEYPYYAPTSFQSLQVIRDIPGLAFDPELLTTTGEAAVVSAGSEAAIWLTNLEDQVVLLEGDGSAVLVQLDSRDWPRTIDGVDESAYFSEQHYAG